MEFSAFRDKHDAAVSALEATVYKLELDNRQLERQLMILTNSDMKKVDASENRLVKLMAENVKVAENAPDATVGASMVHLSLRAVNGIGKVRGAGLQNSLTRARL